METFGNNFCLLNFLTKTLGNHDYTVKMGVFFARSKGKQSTYIGFLLLNFEQLETASKKYILLPTKNYKFR